jgi:hypothetical protein
MTSRVGFRLGFWWAASGKARRGGDLVHGGCSAAAGADPLSYRFGSALSAGLRLPVGPPRSEAHRAVASRALLCLYRAFFRGVGHVGPSYGRLRSRCFGWDLLA